MIIRKENQSDAGVITAITEAAFTNCPYSHNTEQFIIHALRAAGALTVSLVAELDGKRRLIKSACTGKIPPLCTER